MKWNPLPALLVLSFIVACSSSHITHSWKTRDGIPSTFHKILVVGIGSDTELSTRERMEQHLTGDLRDLGYTASSSLEEFGPKAFRNLNEDSMLSKVQEKGFDAVLTVVLLDKSRERYYVPARVYYTPYIIYHRRFWGYYSTMYDRIYSPGYYSVNTKYFWESNLYDVATRELLYSVQTESFDASGSDQLAHEYGKMIVKDMVSKQVIVKR